MEALSGAASGIAVVSLTIQLIQSVALVREFIKDVKGASKEFHRLAGKLELLNALLEDAHKVLEQQSSLSGMHFPTPSIAIFKCLQGCEESIKPLVDTVKKLRLPKSQSSSSTARLKSEIKLGLKTKEITTLETRIQQDIDLLSTSLSVNQNSILMNVFPILLRNQDKMLKSNDNLPGASVLCSDLGPTVRTLDTVSAFASSPVQYSQQTILVRSAFERLGLYRHKVIRYQDQRIEDSEGNFKSYKRDILCTADEVSAVWKFLGFGMTFTQQHPYGSILPSLRTYPVVELAGGVFDMVQSESVQQLQARISYGVLHPFMRTATGVSLLHYAAVIQRPDVCRLLLGYGVKPELTIYDESPLSAVLSISSYETLSTNKIEVYRCLFEGADLADEFKRSDSHHRSLRSAISMVEAQWLWGKNLELLVGEHLRNNQRMIIRRFWSGVANQRSQSPIRFSSRHDIQLPNFVMNRDTLNDIQYGRCQILEAMFLPYSDSMFSYIVGTRFLDWLISLDLDPELYVDNERARLEGSRHSYPHPKRIVFERNWKQRWILGFEWVLDYQAPGYSLLSEYPTLTFECSGPYYWPFTGWDSTKNWDAVVCSALFNRRMAAKERKERARLGQKQPRSRMPGAWKW